MTRTLIRCAAAATCVIGLSACDLEVRNPNDPETERVLATPADLESLLANFYKRWHDGLYRTLGSVWGMANVQSFENYSSLANNCQNQRAGIPRAINDNSIGNSCGGEQQRVYFVHSEVVRVASTALTQLEDLTLGSAARDARARAFAEFLRGVALGYMALLYDSAAVISPTMSAAPEDCVPDPLTGSCVGALRGYREVMDSALVALERSIQYATPASASETGGFPLPSTWIPSSTSFTATEFIRLVRSYRARLRANVARTPTERAAVDWDAVIADAQNGITARTDGTSGIILDHDNITNTTTGPFKTWVAQSDTYGLWHQMAPFVIGMGDVSGRYEAWLGQPLEQRGAGNQSFFMVTPDLRFPQGADRATQQADFAITACTSASTPCERYFVNRPAGSDQFAGLGWGWSNYDFVRFHSWRVSGDGTGQNGRIPFFTRAELDMLEAEGHIRKSNFGAAAALINKTRTRGMEGNPPVARGGGLPAVAAAADAGLTGTDCVPKMPVNASRAGGGTARCGDLMEAMKWEKRIETAYTHFAAWFLDSRGWGDLAEGTPLHWAVPYQDLLSRGRTGGAIYSTGVGTTGSAAAGPSTYGW
ncbi:MAG: hypothetical protein M3282_02925 [Gemmatimonadota bacterium]|nr:hypothetical protein [Gemmatimonadota bacterium]